ncbi:MAG: cold-shock protein [Ponticaulis sp.]|nr:cold-shock protein [Ponticaulis sp.]|tara:strand:- start:25319 stop:25534 length:216 start_codon:yes stop_codon:yes gene_type:complete
MATGKVKTFDLNEGFGLIQPDDGSADVLVQIRAAERSGLFALLEGESLFYELDHTSQPGEVLATNLRPIAD